VLDEDSVDEDMMWWTKSLEDKFPHEDDDFPIFPPVSHRRSSSVNDTLRTEIVSPSPRRASATSWGLSRLLGMFRSSQVPTCVLTVHLV
jgi:hypothetical protein